MIIPPEWRRSPVNERVGVLVSLTMLILYVIQLVGPNARPSTPWVTAAWGIIVLTWLAAAIYKTWFTKR